MLCMLTYYTGLHNIVMSSLIFLNFNSGLIFWVNLIFYRSLNCDLAILQQWIQTWTCSIHSKATGEEDSYIIFFKTCKKLHIYIMIVAACMHFVFHPVILIIIVLVSFKRQNRSLHVVITYLYCILLWVYDIDRTDISTRIAKWELVGKTCFTLIN